MKAVLLAGGYGTRLRPLTETIPKCLVPIKGQPLLDIWLEQLASAGVSEFLVNTHYLPEQVREYVAQSPYRDRVRLVHEETLLGTAGTLRANRAFWQDESAVMVVHADNYCVCDFAAFMAAHAAHPKGCVMTMMVFATDRPQNCGIVEMDGRHIVQQFYEKVANPPGNLANAAIYICDTGMLAALTHETDFSTQVIPAQLGKIYCWRNEGILQDIGTAENYEKFK